MTFGSIFLDFVLPTPTTWFYFSGLLALALFFKFSRLLSVRNLDVVTLFLLVPGLLLLFPGPDKPPLEYWLGYLWLVCGSGYYFFRCLLDLALVQRPALTPNLSMGGLAWLAGVLFVSLIAVAYRQPIKRPEKAPTNPAPVDAATQAANTLTTQASANLGTSPEIRGSDAFTKWAWACRILALLCHLGIVVGLVFVGWRQFQDLHAGMAAATFYLLLPYTYLLIPYGPLGVGQWDQVLPAALVVWAVFCYRMPTLSGMLLGLATGAVGFPLVLFPVWVSFYRGRGAGRFALSYFLFAALCLVVTAISLSLSDALMQNLHTSLMDWLPWNAVPPDSSDGFWTGWSSFYRMPVFIAYAAFVVVTGFWPSPKNLAHVIAHSAAVFLGIQFWFANHGGAYVLWYLPLLLLLAFRPNLSDRQPLPILPESDWLTRLRQAVVRFVVRLFWPQPTAGVP